MYQYVDNALQYANKSTSLTHKHGAICIIGGKIICGGFNYPTTPHYFKGQEEYNPV